MKNKIARLLALSTALAAAPAAGAPIEISNATYLVSSTGETASCETGDIVLGGGGIAPACLTGTEGICGTREHPVYDGPLSDHSGWRYAVRDGAGTIVTTETFANCLDVSAHPELAGIVYLETASGFAVSQVSCETGDMLVGGGAEPTPCSGCPMAMLELDYPINLVDDTAQGRVYAGGWAYGYDHLSDPYYDNTINLAVCLRSTALSWWASVYLMQQAGSDVWCEPGDRVLAGGGHGPRCDSGSENACVNPVQYSHDGPIFDSGTESEGWRYAPFTQGVGCETAMAYAICARADPDEDGWLEEEGDCDPESADAAPDLPEVCGDGIDNNCNGFADFEDFACPDPELEPEPGEPAEGAESGDAMEPAPDALQDSAPGDPLTDFLHDASPELPGDAGEGDGGGEGGCGCSVVR